MTRPGAGHRSTTPCQMPIQQKREKGINFSEVTVHVCAVHVCVMQSSLWCCGRDRRLAAGRWLSQSPRGPSHPQRLSLRTLLLSADIILFPSRLNIKSFQYSPVKGLQHLLCAQLSEKELVCKEWQSLIYANMLFVVHLWHKFGCT